MTTKKSARRKAPKRTRNPSPSPGRVKMFKRASALTKSYGGSPAARLALVRAKELLDWAEYNDAAHVEHRESEFPDTSWMDARDLKAYKRGDIDFYDTLLIDDTTGRVIASLGESSVGKKAADRDYLKHVGLELVSENKAAVIAAIKRAQRRVENPGRRKAPAKRRATARRRTR